MPAPHPRRHCGVAAAADGVGSTLIGIDCTSVSDGFDTFWFAVPVLLAQDPHTPLLRGAPVSYSSGTSAVIKRTPVAITVTSWSRSMGRPFCASTSIPRVVKSLAG